MGLKGLWRYNDGDDEGESVQSFDEGDNIDNLYGDVNACDVSYSNIDDDVTNANTDFYYILDGGCSKSQSFTLKRLRDVKPCDRKIVVANGNVLNTVAEGTVGNIRNISYTPGLHRNLLSEKQLIQQGYGIIKMNLNYADIICKTTKKIKGRAYMKEKGLWMIDPSKIKPLDCDVLKNHPEYAMNLSSVKSNNKYNHFENILFMSAKQMLQLKKSQAVKGLSVSIRELRKKRPINLSKVLSSMSRVRTKKKKKNNNKTLPPVSHTIMSDTYGKTNTPGINNEHYISFFIDKGGGMNGVSPMKTKDEWLEKFQIYYAHIRSYGSKIRQFESDMGTEIINKKSLKWMRNRSIHVKSAAPYKHEQTSVVNINIRHTLDKARALINYAKLSLLVM